MEGYKDSIFSLKGPGFTDKRTKFTTSSVYLNLESTNYSNAIHVSIIDGESSDNLSNKVQYFEVFPGQKYELYNLVKERGKNSCKLYFDNFPENVEIKGKWSPDFSQTQKVIILTGEERKKKSDQILTSSNSSFEINLNLGKDLKTLPMEKKNNSSIYLNLKEWSGTANVKIFGTDIDGKKIKNCTNLLDSFIVRGGKKYLLYNTVKEENFPMVYLEFDKMLNGLWSPDSSSKSGAEITLSGKNEDNFDIVKYKINDPIKFIDVPYMNQNDYPTGCESVSSVMLLKAFGINISVDEFLDHVPKQPVKIGNNVNEGPDPLNIFPGDPKTGHGFGCYSPCIANTINSFKFPGILAEASSSKSLNYLCENYINEGFPCLIWATMNMVPTRKTITWKIYNTDKYYTWLGNEHCLLLVGYNNDCYFFNDPYNNNGKIAFKKETVEKRYNEQNCHSVVIKKINENKSQEDLNDKSEK